MTPSESWTCHARPAPSGKPCGHINERGVVRGYRRLLCCEACGCTKRASDDRKRREIEGGAG